MAVKSTAAFGDMRQHLVKIYSGVTVAHSLSRDKEVFDCVPINDQPGVRVRKLKRVAAAANPADQRLGPGQQSSSPSVCETDAGGLEAFGRGADGTIPMRRLTPAELTRFATLKDYFAKGPQGAGRVSRDRGSIPPAFNGHFVSSCVPAVLRTAVACNHERNC